MDFNPNRLSALKSTSNFRAVQDANQFRPTEPKGPPIRARVLPLLVTGGIGDSIVALSLLKPLLRRTQTLEVFTKAPEVFTFFHQGPGIFVRHIDDWPNYDYTMAINSTVSFVLRDHFKGFKEPFLEDIFFHIQKKQEVEGWKFYVRYHPGSDNELARKAVAVGLNRNTLPHHLTGLEYSPFQRTCITSLLKEFSPYITVNDGQESGVVEPGVGRTMKNWNLDSWNTLCRSLKKKYKRLNIIQLGTKETRKIDFATVDMRGKLQLSDSFRVLAGSKLHLDSDSGLVHAARALGVKSIVLFGPTPRDFYGYKENVNLVGDGCEGSCWWSTNSWLSRCPLSFSRPVCMDSILPEVVFMEACAELTGRV